jgi:hypothetical protein
LEALLKMTDPKTAQTPAKTPVATPAEAETEGR